MKRRDIEHRIQDAFDGEPSDPHVLRDTLLENPAALDLWCDYALMDAELRRHARGRLKIPGTVPAREEVARRVRHRRQIWTSGLAAAAVLVLSAVALRLFLVKPQQWSADLAVSPGSVLTTADGTGMTGDRLPKNIPLTLSQGVAKLDLPNGVTAVIEGPASFRLTGENAVALEGGHSWFRVPSGAKGFKVTASSVEVLDLGTEFGIDLREDQPAAVHVLDGAVEAVARSGNGEKIRISAGQACSLAPNGRWQALPGASPHFRTALPSALPELRMDFEEIRDGSLVLEGDILGSRHAGTRLHGIGGARLVPGIDGLALELDGTSAWLETDWPGISGTAPRSVALWCRIPPGTRHLTTPPFALWGNPVTGWNRKFKVAPRTGNDGRTVLRASFGDYLIDGRTEIADGEWHHLAVVYRGSNPDGEPLVTLYVDGKEELATHSGVTSGPILTDTDSSHYGMTLGRYELNARGRNPYLCATLDSLRIFAGALDPAEIRDLAGQR